MIHREPDHKMREGFTETSVLVVSVLKWFALASIVGVLVGGSTSLFLWSLEWATGGVSSIPYHAALLPVGMFLSALFVKYLAPDAEGHGTEKVIEAIHQRAGVIKPLVVPVKLLATVVTLASGGSAGKEGPCAQIGAGISSTLASLFRFDATDRKKLVICGVSAGFSTVFGTPVAGALFGVEVLAIGQLQYAVLFPSFVAGIVGYQISAAFGTMYFHHPISFLPTFSELFFFKVVLAGVAFGIISFLFIEILKLIEGFSKRLRWWKPLKGLFGGALLLGTLFLGDRYLGLGLTTIRLRTSQEHQPRMTILCLIAVLFFPSPSAADSSDSLCIIDRPDSLRARLLAEEDTDGDTRITVLDPPVPGTERGDRLFWIDRGPHQPWEVRGTYRLSVLLEDLTVMSEHHESPGRLTDLLYREKPADRLARSIHERLWDGLTRRMDERGLPDMLRDDKVSTADDSLFLYVPASDSSSMVYYNTIIARHPEWRAALVRLPRHIDDTYVRSRERRHGLLTLGLDSQTGQPRAFVVPGGRFNEMYGWDSYFIVLGLVRDGRWELAQSMIDNMVYEIRFYGKILNANRTYYLTRSQPPFLTSMLVAVLPGLPRNSTTDAWVRGVIEAAMIEYETVWNAPPRLTATGLSRYRGEGTGIPPEVEPGHFAPLFAGLAGPLGMSADSLEHLYKNGTYRNASLDTFFVNDRAMRESGHDTSYRLYGRCARLVTVDLNSLLYAYERDIAMLIEKRWGGVFPRSDGRRELAGEWTRRAENRKRLMLHYLWNPEANLFFDYDVDEGRQTGYISATTLYPLWAGIVSDEMAARIIQTALPQLEMPGGLAGSTELSRGPIGPQRPLRQWDYPYGWSPHQMLAWGGLVRYGFLTDARRLAYRWLYTIVANAASYQGTVPEKFDVVRRSHQVFAEYGNVGTTFSYITREGFGWTNASVLVGLFLLTPQQRDLLNDLVPPEGVNFR